MLTRGRVISRFMSQVDFGSKMIEKDAKQSAVNEIFSKIAANYDLMNDLMSMGVHRLWKDEFVSDMGDFHPNHPLHFLDMAGGTGDIAFRIMDKIQRENSTYTKIQSTVTVSDINADMLNEGKKRSKDRNFSNLDWVVANAEELPFADASFDFYTIVFGIRNVPDRLKALKEAHRVLKTGGRFMCMEFSKVILPGFDFIYSQYSKMVIPTLGQFIANDRESYVYLIESIERFPTQEEFASLINEAGFNHVNHRNLSFGICAIHSGVKI